MNPNPRLVTLVGEAISELAARSEAVANALMQKFEQVVGDLDADSGQLALGELAVLKAHNHRIRSRWIECAQECHKGLCSVSKHSHHFCLLGGCLVRALAESHQAEQALKEYARLAQVLLDSSAPASDVAGFVSVARVIIVKGSSSPIILEALVSFVEDSTTRLELQQTWSQDPLEAVSRVSKIIGSSGVSGMR